MSKCVSVKQRVVTMELVMETGLTLVEVDLLNVGLRTVTKYNTPHLLRGILSKCHEDQTIWLVVTHYCQ